MTFSTRYAGLEFNIEWANFISAVRLSSFFLRSCTTLSKRTSLTAWGKVLTARSSSP